jgi:hypothetical protein
MADLGGTWSGIPISTKRQLSSPPSGLSPGVSEAKASRLELVHFQAWLCFRPPNSERRTQSADSAPPDSASRQGVRVLPPCVQTA